MIKSNTVVTSKTAAGDSAAVDDILDSAVERMVEKTSGQARHLLGRNAAKRTDTDTGSKVD